jgi:hypothetical protein
MKHKTIQRILKSFRRHTRNMHMNVSPRKRKAINAKYMANKSTAEREVIAGRSRKVGATHTKLNDAIRRALKITRRRYPFVRGTVLFGSASRGNIRLEHDVDCFHIINIRELKTYEKARPGETQRSGINDLTGRLNQTPALAADNIFSNAIKEKMGVGVGVAIPMRGFPDFRAFIQYDPKNVGVMVNSVLSLMGNYDGVRYEHTVETPGGEKFYLAHQRDRKKYGREKPTVRRRSFTARKPGFSPKVHQYYGDPIVRKQFSQALEIINQFREAGYMRGNRIGLMPDHIADAVERILKGKRLLTMEEIV